MKRDKHLIIIAVLLAILVAVGAMGYTRVRRLQEETSTIQQDRDENLSKLRLISDELAALKAQDQYQRNEELQQKIKDIETTYIQAVSLYEQMLDLKAQNKPTKGLDPLFTQALALLGKQDYQKAKETLAQLEEKIKAQNAPTSTPAGGSNAAPASNEPPTSGYSRQTVTVDGLGNYTVSLVAGDLGNTRVLVDTAATSDCSNECPTLSLGDYVGRNGAYAGVNGSYFCPAEYPSCAGKTNSFDLLVMNKDKVYFNSANNIYSTNPAVIFLDDSTRFVGAAFEWGRDTSPSGVLSNFPLIVSGGNVAFGGDDDPKKGSKGNRSFVANRGSTAYIGVVHSATVAESARVLTALDMDNALNLDDGGSTALWDGGYKVGPGRNLPNVILFVNK